MKVRVNCGGMRDPGDSVARATRFMRETTGDPYLSLMECPTVGCHVLIDVRNRYKRCRTCCAAKKQEDE